MKSVVIVSRQSELARRQADIVAAKWRRAHPRCRIKIIGIKSRGDKIVDRALADIGGKDLFVKELEAEIDAGRADCAVHSLKDVGAVLPPRFALAAFLSAADSRDAVISNRNLPLANLPPGATVGTASPRRRALLAARHPRLRAVLMRGNVASRIAKMRRGDCDALLLAAAGLHRLGRGGDICEILDAERFPPAVGQGLLAIECAADRPDVIAAARALDEPQAARRAAIGRALAAAMDADCHTALGARIRFENKRARVFAFYAPPRGGFVEAQIESEQAPQIVGARLAAKLRARLAARVDSRPVLLTRPRGKNGALAAALRARGIATRILPLATIEPAAASVVAAARARAATARIWIVVSANAIAAFFARKTVAPDIVIAVGEQTARALSRFGIDAVAGGGDTASLLRMPQLRSAKIRAQTVAVIGGESENQGVSPPLCAILRERGARVFALPVYRRATDAKNAARAAELIRKATIGAAVFYNGESMRIAFAAARAIGCADDFLRLRVYVSHPQIAAAARKDGFRAVAAAPADSTKMAEAIAVCGV